MGHKEDLLAGARAVLLERGYADTTARDIVAASHTNLASIGYHYGSLDALLTQAMIDMMGEWGERFEAAAAAADASSPEAKFRAIWTRLFEMFDADRALLVASFEIALRAMRSDELKAIFAQTYTEVRHELPRDIFEVDRLDARTRTAIGGVLLALISGVSIQYVLDPKGAPGPDDLVLALKAIGKAFAEASGGLT